MKLIVVKAAAALIAALIIPSGITCRLELPYLVDVSFIMRRVAESKQETILVDSSDNSDNESVPAVASRKAAEEKAETVQETDPSVVEISSAESTAAASSAPAVEETTAPPTTAAAVHVHTWSPVTELIHHAAEYTTVHHEAVTEKVWKEDKPAWDETQETRAFVGAHDICKGCGLDLDTAGMTPEEEELHELRHIQNGEESSFYNEAIYETVTTTVHHDAEGHYEDKIVREAYDENVLSSPDWDEEVISGYVCSDCGAVK